MVVSTPSLSDLTTVMGIATVATILTQVILNAASLSDDASNRWGPLLALLIGVIVGVGAIYALGGSTKVDFAQAAYTGLIGGGTSIAFHSVFSKSAVGDVIAAALGIQKAPPPPPPGDPVTGIAVLTSGPKAAF